MPPAGLPLTPTQGQLDEAGELRVERCLSHHGVPVLIDVDVDGVEGCLVEGDPLFVRAGAVESVGPLEDLEGGGQAAAHFVVVTADAVQEPAGVSQFSLQRFLTRPQVLQRKGVGQVSVEQFLLLALDGGDAPGLGLDELALAGPHLVELILDDLFQLLAQVTAEANVLPVVGDGGFDGLSCHVGQIAVVALGVPTQAEEVLVAPASARGGAEAEPFAAAVAVEAAFQVLLLLPGPVAGDAPVAQDGLDAEEGLVINEPLVFALVVDAAVEDPADVVAVA